MSTYSDASLIYYPSGYKAGTAYSLKPTDGSGDLTFTRASTATRVNADGLIEGVRTNLLTYSEQFDNAAWIKTHTTITANTTTSPSGFVDADKLVGTALLNVHIASQGYGSSPAGVYAASVFLKKDEYNFGLVRLNTNSSTDRFSALINLTNGAIENTYTVGSPTSTSFKVDDYGSGWYRLTITNSHTSGGTSIAVAMSNTASPSISGGLPTFLADGTSGIYIYGAQLEQSASATEYIPTTTTAVSVGMLANVPRIDYTGGGCGKLLLEPQRTNLITYSEDFTNAIWVKIDCSVVSNFGASPSGETNASKLTFTTTSTSARAQYNLSGLTAGSTYTQSYYIKSLGTDITLRIGTSASVVGEFEDITATSEWQRFDFTSVASDTTEHPRIQNISGTQGAQILVYGAQMELGSYATSYIPTSGTAVTRVADAASKTGISSLINSTEGVLYVEIAALADDLTYRAISISNNTQQNQLLMEYEGVTNKFRAYLAVSNNLDGLISVTINTTQDNKIAYKYAENDLALWINGVEVGSFTGTKAMMPINTMTTLRFTRGNDTQPFYGKCQNLMIFPTALSDDDLTLLTGTLGETYFESYALMANYLNYTIQ